MSDPQPTAQQVGFFRAHGWIVVKGVLPAADLDALEARCDTLLPDKGRYACDRARDEKENREERSFRIVRSSPGQVWGDITQQPYPKWLAAPRRIHFSQEAAERAKPKDESTPPLLGGRRGM